MEKNSSAKDFKTSADRINNPNSSSIRDYDTVQNLSIAKPNL